MIDLTEIKRIEENAELLFSNQEVDERIREIAQEINHTYKTLNPVVLCIMNGGLVFCGKLLPLLNFPLQLDYAHATRYNNTTDGNSLEWRVIPTINLKGRNVLIVDDIYDVGETLAGVIEACSSQNTASVKSAVLVDKKHSRKYNPEFKADYVALETDDRYLFGYGMDYKSYLRNAAGIFAVSESNIE